MIIALSIALTIAAVIIVALVLSQNGKSKGLSGSIAGGAETFFGKDKGNKREKFLNRITAGLSIVFCVVLLFLYIVQPDYKAITTPSSGVGGGQYQLGEDSDTDDAKTTEAPESDAETGAESTPADTDAETEAESTPADTDAETPDESGEATEAETPDDSETAGEGAPVV